jgi:hypothetical protein
MHAARPLVVVVLMFAASPAMAELKVHVNRVALEADGPKSALVESDQAGASGEFTVLRDGKPVLVAPLVALPDLAEWGASKHYYLAEFSKLRDPGRYRVRARMGEARQQSTEIVVARDALFKVTAGALIDYFRQSRWLDMADHHIHVFGSDRWVDVWGGWRDAGGDNGKYLSHLSYANFFNPQQAGLTAWALARVHEAAPSRLRAAGLERPLVEEALYGADFMHRLLSPEGYFYMTVFEGWGRPGAERAVTGYVGEQGEFTKDYQAALREGAGVAIAALARASRLSRQTGMTGEFSAATYLADAKRAFAHLAQRNREYDDDGVENIIDDYTGLLAAVELYRSTKSAQYREAADRRARNLAERLTPAGWFRSDATDRPFYHAADAGFPVMALSEYLSIARPADAPPIRAAIARALVAQLTLNAAVANPFDYPRQTFRLYRDGKRGAELLTGFFMPHANETGYWWQGEDARLASLAVAATAGGRAAEQSGAAFGVSGPLAALAQHSLDWILGRNPFDVCMLYGFGGHNPDYSESSETNLVGGIANGITGAVGSDEGRGISFAPGPDDENWRWDEQWLPHSTWLLLSTALLNPEAPTPARSGTAAAVATP